MTSDKERDAKISEAQLTFAMKSILPNIMKYNDYLMLADESMAVANDVLQPDVERWRGALEAFRIMRHDLFKLMLQDMMDMSDTLQLYVSPGSPEVQ